MNTDDRPPVSGEPSTDHGKRILREWLVLRPDHPPNTALIRDWIVKAEAEARATPPSLDVERRLDQWARDNRGITSIPTTHEGLDELLAIVELARARLTSKEER